LTGTDYQTAAGLVRYLKEAGIAKEIGTRPNKAGKGKPSTLYTLPKRVELVFGVPEAVAA